MPSVSNVAFDLKPQERPKTSEEDLISNIIDIVKDDPSRIRNELVYRGWFDSVQYVMNALNAHEVDPDLLMEVAKCLRGFINHVIGHDIVPLVRDMGYVSVGLRRGMRSPHWLCYLSNPGSCKFVKHIQMDPKVYRRSRMDSEVPTR